MTEKINKADTLSEYQTLYRIGGAASWIVVFLVLGMVVGQSLFPQPATVRAWFQLFEQNLFIGLLDFWGLEMIMYILFVPVFLALYILLKELDHGVAAIAAILTFLGVGIFLSTNNPFTMLSLSRQYASAAFSAQRAVLLAAGQAVLANTGQRVVGGFNTGLFLVSLAGLIFSVLMLKVQHFRRSTAWVGVWAYAFSLADYLRQILTQSVLIALLVILPGAVLLLIWFALVGKKLWKLSQGKQQEAGMPPVSKKSLA